MLQKNKKFKIDQSDWSNLHTSTWQVLALTSDEAMWQIVENNCPYMTDFYVRHHPHLILGFVDLSGCTLSGQATKLLILCNHVSFKRSGSGHPSMNHSSFYYLYMYVKKNASWCHCPPTCIDIIYILHVYLSLCV